MPMRRSGYLFSEGRARWFRKHPIRTLLMGLAFLASPAAVIVWSRTVRSLLTSPLDVVIGASLIAVGLVTGPCLLFSALHVLMERGARLAHVLVGTFTLLVGFGLAILWGLRQDLTEPWMNLWEGSVVGYGPILLPGIVFAYTIPAVVILALVWGGIDVVRKSGSFSSGTIRSRHH